MCRHRLGEIIAFSRGSYGTRSVPATFSESFVRDIHQFRCWGEIDGFALGGNPSCELSLTSYFARPFATLPFASSLEMVECRESSLRLAQTIGVEGQN